MSQCTHGIELCYHCPECQKFEDIVKSAKVQAPNKSTATVHQFTGITSLNHEPDWILEKAQGKLKQVVVIGYEEDGSFFFSGSHADGPENLWLLEVAKRKLIDIVEG